MNNIIKREVIRFHLGVTVYLIAITFHSSNTAEIQMYFYMNDLKLGIITGTVHLTEGYNYSQVPEVIC
jgi:hypothetical protein